MLVVDVDKREPIFPHGTAMLGEGYFEGFEKQNNASPWSECEPKDIMGQQAEEELEFILDDREMEDIRPQAASKRLTEGEGGEEARRK